MKKIIFLFIFSCFLLYSHYPVQAIVQKTGENIYLNSNEIIEDDLIATGKTIEINGLIKGDLFVIGQTITINGNVEGDIIGIGGKLIIINGNVNGNVRVFGQIVKFNNQIDKNINVFGEEIEINGKINGNVYGTGNNIFLAGEINKNINLYAKESLVLRPKTIIRGDLNYIAPQKMEIQSGAQILGKTFYKTSFEKKEKEYTVTFFFWKLVSLFGFLIIGLILTSLFREKTLEIANQIKKTPWKNLGFGIIYFLIIPMILLLLFAVLIGIPLALIGMCLYLILLYLSQLFVGIMIGIEIDKKIRKPIYQLADADQKQKNNLILPMALGMIILTILFNIPYLGLLIRLITIWIGFGGIIANFNDKFSLKDQPLANK